MELYTSRYHAGALLKSAIEERGLIPLGITTGSARYLAYELAGNVGPLAPFNLRHLEGQEFDLAYAERLERFGVEGIERVLASFAEAYGARGCVLLCFEKVEEGEHCHRRTFADWWETKTGVAVPELSAAALRNRKEK